MDFSNKVINAHFIINFKNTEMQLNELINVKR